MENFTSPTTAEQARKTAREAQRLGADVKKDFEDAVARGRDAADAVGDDAKSTVSRASERARETVRAAGRSLGRTAGKVSAYADENTAVVAVAAFGAGLLVGHLVSRDR